MRFAVWRSVRLNVFRLAIGVFVAHSAQVFAFPSLFAPRGEVGCAGDGAPTRRFEASGLFSGLLAPYSSGASFATGDALDSGPFLVPSLRFGVCGRVAIKHGALLYDVIYEPWSAVERARPNAPSWGRLTAAELGYAPVSWVTVWAGVHKVAFSFGHDEPEGALAIPFRPATSTLFAPDRRLGLTADFDLGAARLVGGVYASAPELDQLPSTGLLATVRLLIDPIGPIGSTISTVNDNAFWQKRPRFGLDLSAYYAWRPEVSSFSVGGDLPFKYGPVGFVVEYLFQQGLTNVPQESSTVPLPAPPHQGLWAQLAVMVWRPFIEVEARYEWLDAADLPVGRFNALTLGGTLYALSGALRVQAVYEHKFPLQVVPPVDALAFVVTIAR